MRKVDQFRKVLVAFSLGSGIMDLFERQTGVDVMPGRYINN